MGTSSLLAPSEHVLSTLEKDGSRRWLFPRLTKGPWWRARQIVGYALIVLFVALPNIRINGKPAILLDVSARHFTFFGYTFLPTDTMLLALFMLSVFLTIFLLTALFGRVWCGWACPQTVYMEYVFRPVERFFDGTMGRGGKPSASTPALRRMTKYVVYFILSMGLAHTFLAYFVGVDRLSQWVRQSPIEHPIPFLVMAFTTGLMMFDFCFFREQLCLIACPYGRFQSVLLDRQSLIVGYDSSRGEPRGKVKRGGEKETSLGDCVDCGACVRTCPTGIDIRDGLQMECINCTQCIDACDEIMVKLERPKGLIRYSCQDTIAGKPKRRFRPRLIIYPAALAIVLTIFVTALVTKKGFDVTVLRNLGSPFIVTTEGAIQNSMRLKIVNRRAEPVDFSVQVLDQPNVVTNLDGQTVHLEAGQTVTQPILFTTPFADFKEGRLLIDLEVKSTKGERRNVSWRLLGPNQLPK